VKFRRLRSFERRHLFRRRSKRRTWNTHTHNIVDARRLIVAINFANPSALSSEPMRRFKVMRIQRLRAVRRCAAAMMRPDGDRGSLSKRHWRRSRQGRRGPADTTYPRRRLCHVSPMCCPWSSALALMSEMRPYDTAND